MGALFSPGKLLLTSEYVVLDGALALAVPTKWGQEFFFEEIQDGKSLIHWKALHQGQVWLNALIDYKNAKVLNTNISDSAAFILKVLLNVKELSIKQFQQDHSYSITTNLQFPADYGLGSSSTLMNNLAQWANIDAFELNEISLGGSGYDIAVAKENSSLLFQNSPSGRIIKRVNFAPSFTNELLFIHLNKKQDSREGIDLYRGKQKSEELIAQFSAITEEVLKVQTLENFSQLMTLHEKKLSQFLETETAKEKYFENCPVFIKSLGAWGGDFILTSKFPGFKDYFQGKGFTTIFAYKELIN